MTDTFQGGKGLSGKIERLIWKRADTEKRSKKEHFYFQSWLHQREGSTMIRPVSNCWKKVDKRLTKSNHFVTSGKQESDQYLTDENPEKKADWQAWLQQWLVDWGKKQIWTRRKQGFDLYLQSDNPGRKVDWEWLVDWKKRIWTRIDPELICPPKMFSNTSWLTGLTTVVGWLKESLGALLLPTIVGCCITVHQTFTTSKQPRITSEEWLI